MGILDLFGDHENSYNEYQGVQRHEHEAKTSHELIAGAASYEAMKAYEEHLAREGKPDNHAKAKEMLAAAAGAFIDREFETKGLDFLDRERAKHQARENINERFTEDLYQGY